jgi:hypothetical protein
METVQRDITQSMRGILIDWLVEVSVISLPEIILTYALRCFALTSQFTLAVCYLIRKDCLLYHQ